MGIKGKVLLHLICWREFSPCRGLDLWGALVWLIIYRIVETVPRFLQELYFRVLYS
jgi:hypothetical protein